jgi:hypothetical protein
MADGVSHCAHSRRGGEDDGGIDISQIVLKLLGAVLYIERSNDATDPCHGEECSDEGSRVRQH